MGAGIGHDYAVLNGQVVAHGLADSTLPYVSMQMTIGEAALIRALNQLAVSGAVPIGFHVVMLVPADDEERTVRREMERLTQMADQNNMQIIGGHTEVSSAISELTVSITAYGLHNKIFPVAKICPGDKLIMTGHAGMMGAAMITAAHMTELKERFAESYIRQASSDKEAFNLRRAAWIAFSHDARYLHDVSFGGVYGAISQMAEMAGLGVNIDHGAIPVRQEVIEICEVYNINPYLLLGTGSLLIACSEENTGHMTRVLRRNGIRNSVIGTFTEQKEKIVVSEAFDMRRHITPQDGDEIYKVF